MFKAKLKKIMRKEIENHSVMFNIRPSVEKLLSTDLPVVTSHNLSKLVNKTMEEVAHVNQTNHSLIKKYGKCISDNQWVIPPEDLEGLANYNSDIQELLESEVEFPGFNPIKLSELGSIKLSGFDMAELEGFLIIE